MILYNNDASFKCISKYFFKNEVNKKVVKLLLISDPGD